MLTQLVLGSQFINTKKMIIWLQKNRVKFLTFRKTSVSIWTKMRKRIYFSWNVDISLGQYFNVFGAFGAFFYSEARK